MRGTIAKRAGSQQTIDVALIEDDIAISTMYKQRFDMEGGFTVKIANNGQEGLELLKTYQPDVILLDMMMPKMSGLETLQHIRKLPVGDKLKVIALTNMNDPDTVKAMENLGVIQHIVKANSSPGIIVETVRAVVSVKH